MKSFLLYMHHGRLKWVIWLTLAAGITSCEDIIDVKFSGDKAKNLVVEGSITTDTMSHHVKLSYTGDYFDDTEEEMATGAEVSITDGTNIFPLLESSPGDYHTDINLYGEVGKKYTLHIKLPDGREFSASDSLRGVGPIDSIRQSVNYNTLLYGYGYDVIFYGREPEPSGDHYMYLLSLDGNLYTDTITEVRFVSDEFVNGNYVRDYAVFRIRETDLQKNANVTLAMYSISKEYYDFLSAMMVETVWRGSPWDGPPANIPGNISNGATGFFRASAVSRKSRYFLPLDRINK